MWLVIPAGDVWQRVMVKILIQTGYSVQLPSKVIKEMTCQQKTVWQLV